MHGSNDKLHGAAVHVMPDIVAPPRGPRTHVMAVPPDRGMRPRNTVHVNASWPYPDHTYHAVQFRSFVIRVDRVGGTYRAIGCGRDRRPIADNDRQAMVLCEGPDRDAVIREGCSIWRESLRRWFKLDRSVRKRMGL